MPKRALRTFLLFAAANCFVFVIIGFVDMLTGRQSRRDQQVSVLGYEAKNDTRSPIQEYEVERLMTERQKEVEERCEEVLTPEEMHQPPNSKEFLISDKYQLVWCNVFKAASSTWLNNFLLMYDLKIKKILTRNSPVEQARKFYHRPSVEVLDSCLTQYNYTSFIIVREPFQRLISAFRDKLETDRNEFYKSLRCQIKLNFGDGRRTGKLRGWSRDCLPSFSEFIEYLLDEEAHGRSPNEHWAPYYRFCSPCQVHFTYILHFETLTQDEAFLLKKVPGLSDVLKPQKLHNSHTNYDNVIHNYFRQLTRTQLQGLLDIYSKDFTIFGYKHEKYFDYVTTSS
ncbi:carbohydrate sulfotransferase 12-like [Homarus americanus]|uniref:carbohydrate sulfotransferase 12-like n=1 Tax=Homarus americanus TaxID=6706 RepID=UPI001C45503B|nr:carbohydrate sulfotransferase 12-like [Homarus americanus]XP_042208959.1 carbohydrate sulfotransferase 12-like [Homarus americanus]XP_042208960.1 carbohydrate sulfotransferase 12-like [Homarus americanus]